VEERQLEKMRSDVVTAADQEWLWSAWRQRYCGGLDESLEAAVQARHQPADDNSADTVDDQRRRRLHDAHRRLPRERRRCSAPVRTW
jgi:hypothetical protein